MAIFNQLFTFLHKKAQNNSGVDPSIKSTQPVVLKPSVPPQKQSKSLAELEKEAEARYYATYPHKQSFLAKPAKAKGGLLSKIIWVAIILGIPFGVIWAANLPYPLIRRPVAQKVPILLLPSYMEMDSHYRQALTSVEQAQQLIDHATSAADLNLGEQKVKEAQNHLDALPIWVLTDSPDYRYWWYYSELSIYGFNTARTKVGQLAAKVFQEKNAHTLLADSEQAILAAKQQYQQAPTPTDKQVATTSWRLAIDQLKQIPGQTLAGKTAQAKLDNYQHDFQDVVGLATGSDRVSTLIEGAQQFSWQAAKAGQNPPHTVTEWQQVEALWQQAIERLEQIPNENLAGYAQAQRLLAQYNNNLGQVKIRRQAEQNSVYALEQAQRQIQSLVYLTTTHANSLERNHTISELQRI